MDDESRRFFQAILTCLALSTFAGLAVVSLIAWLVA